MGGTSGWSDQSGVADRSFSDMEAVVDGDEGRVPASEAGGGGRT